MPKANDTRDRAVLILHRGPMTAGEFGAAMWPGRTGRITSSSGGGDYAAQMLLGRLRAKGIVRTTLDPGATRWELTSRGKELLRVAGDHDITDKQIRDLQAVLFAGQADEQQLSGLLACHDALGRSHRRSAARAHCAELISKMAWRPTPCRKCGTHLMNWWRFCPFCGQQIGPRRV
jgi:hypothetical protein